MLKVLSNILCDLDPKVKVIGQKAGICDGVPIDFCSSLIHNLAGKSNTVLEFDRDRCFFLL